MCLFRWTLRRIREKFDSAGITVLAYNYSFRDDFTDEEIERGFLMAKALGAPAITASSTVSVTRSRPIRRDAQDAASGCMGMTTWPTRTSCSS